MEQMAQAPVQASDSFRRAYDGLAAFRHLVQERGWTFSHGSARMFKNKEMVRHYGKLLSLLWLCDFRVRRNLFVSAVFTETKTSLRRLPSEGDGWVHHEHERH